MSDQKVKTEMIPVRMTEELKERLDRLAENSRKSRSELMRDILERNLPALKNGLLDETSDPGSIKERKGLK